MILKNFNQFINENKEDNSSDHYYDDQTEKLLSEMKDFNKNKNKLDSFIKKYDYSENSDRKLNKIINSNSLLLAYWTILKKKKRVEDLNTKSDILLKDIKDLKTEEDSDEAISKKKDQIDKVSTEIKEVEVEYKDLEKTLQDKEKDIKIKISELQKKLVN